MLRRASLSIGLCLMAAAHARAADAPGDPARGQRLFLQCRACHTVGAGEANGVGPNLWNVVGAKAAAKPGFKYSPALSASGLTWTPETLDTWLLKPTALVPGTTMAIAGVAAPASRADLIAYMATLKPAAPTR